MARLVTIFKDRKSPKGHTFILSHNLRGEEFYLFKRQNREYINRAVKIVKSDGRSFTFDIDDFLFSD